MQLIRTTLFSLLATLVLPGCSFYQPRPLTTTDLAKALAFPDKKQMMHHATLLNHPRIPPINLDFSKPLTTKELSVIAVLASPDLRALRAKEGVAKAQVFNAGLLPDPQFAYSFAHPLDAIPGLTNAYSSGLNWDIGSLVTRLTNLSIAEAQAQQIRYDIAWQEWLVANQAELLASRVYFLQQQLNLTQKATKTAKRILDLTQLNLSKHNSTIDQFGLRQSIYLDFLDQSFTIERTLRKTALQLKQMLGIPPSSRVSLNFEPFPMPTLNADILFKEAEVNRLDLLALQAGYASQEAKLYQAILGQFPHFTIGIAKARDTTNVHTNGGGINFDIPLFNRNQGTIAIANTTREQLYLEYISRLNKTRSDIATLVTELELLSKEATILKAQLPKMEKAERLMRDGVHTGNITLITYEAVLTSLLSNQLRLLTLKQNITEQIIALQIEIGKCQQGESHYANEI